jgi:glycerophosphoryl diester phosphodiesterase
MGHGRLRFLPVVGGAAFALCTASTGARVAPPHEVVGLRRLVAHAGGAIDGLTYTNSAAALDASYARGFRTFEVDFNWTSDGALVLLHDWNDLFEQVFQAPCGRRSLAEFRQLRMVGGFRQMTAGDLESWLRAHPDAYLITDVKERNLDALGQIAFEAPGLVSRIVPQVFELAEYEPVRALGYRRVILATYRMTETDAEIVSWVSEHAVFAVSMWKPQALGSIVGQLARLGVPVYAHTENRVEHASYLMANGVAGIYTDSLAQQDLGLGGAGLPGQKSIVTTSESE